MTHPLDHNMRLASQHYSSQVCKSDFHECHVCGQHFEYVVQSDKDWRVCEECEG